MAQSRTEVRRTADSQRTCPFIISPHRPTDSQGETVYEVQGDDQLDIPAVPGACALPVLVSHPKIKFPKDLKDSRHSASLDVTAVVTAQGALIDPKTPDGVDPEVAKAATDALLQFKFKPATLSGKPVAVVVKIPFNFVLTRFLGLGAFPKE